MTQLVLYGLIAGLFSLIGGFIVLWRSEQVLKIITPLLAFAAGSFLAVSFLDLLPEAVESVQEPHYIFIALLVGFSLFFFLERVLMRYFHQHQDNIEHGDHTESLPLLLVLGDSLHNFLDGIVIALSFIANPALGMTTALAIAAHELPQEIGDFSILLDRGWSKGRIIGVNIASSLLTILGAVITFYTASLFESWIPYLLGGVSGIFIYIAASDLIPEIHHRAGHKSLYRVFSAFLLGILLVGYLIMQTHG